MLYKFIYKENSKLKNEVIDAGDIEVAGGMANQYCRENNYDYLNICPFVFDIKSYLEHSQGGVEIMPNPSVFGQRLERRRIQLKGEEAQTSQDKTIPEMVATKK